MKNFKHTEETKKKISDAQKGRKISDEHRKNIGLGHIGIRPTTETRAKLSAWQIGRKMSDEAKKKMSDAKKGKVTWNKGKKLSNEHKEKLSLAKKGKTGELSSRYMKDRSKLGHYFKKERHSYITRKWTKEIKKRDKFMCKINNDECCDRLETHHILNWIDYPELRYDVNNGICLCKFHHPRGRVEENKKVELFKQLINII